MNRGTIQEILRTKVIPEITTDKQRQREEIEREYFNILRVKEYSILPRAQKS